MTKDINLRQDIQTDVSPHDKNIFGKYLADAFFRQQGWSAKKAKSSAYDMLVSDGQQDYAVGVKFGSKFNIQLKRIEKIMSIGGISPALLFISPDKKFVFFVPKEINRVDNNGKDKGAGSEV